MDVLVRILKLERAIVELTLDPPQPSLDRPQLRRGDECRGLQPARMSDAPLDVVRVELIVELERRREPLELREQVAFEAAGPELAARTGYGVSLFALPSR